MTNIPNRRITKKDIQAVRPEKLLFAGVIGGPIGAVLALIFAFVWLSVVPAGDIILVALPVIGGVGGMILGPLFLVRKDMDNRD